MTQGYNMLEIYDDPIEPTTATFRALCDILDSCATQENATCGPDLFSGGYKFSDEAPADFEKLGDHLLPLVDLLRCLWGYRASIVVGKPRADLAHYWEAAKGFAPRWAGFSPERSSPEMKAHIDNVDRLAVEFLAEMERMDRKLRTKSSSLARS
jgi:hypothetical protein